MVPFVAKPVEDRERERGEDRGIRWLMGKPFREGPDREQCEHKIAAGV